MRRPTGTRNCDHRPVDFRGFADHPERCRPEGFTKEAGDLRVELCRITRDGILADAWRYDGSDQMPVEVGAGTFWSGMVDYIDQGPDSLDRVLADIEASWPGDDSS